MYFDLDNPERGPFVASGDEAVPSDWTYVARMETPPDVWAQLITWRQPVSAEQGEALTRAAEEFGNLPEQSPAGEAR